jgi:hypothetical protein
MTVAFGCNTARGFLNRHERTPGQPSDQRAMDQFNNELGLKLGLLMQREHGSLGPDTLKEIDQIASDWASEGFVSTLVDGDDAQAKY